MPKQKTYNFIVRVVLLRENDTWIAQGLDFDITGHGSNTNDALDSFGNTLLGQAIVDVHHGIEPLSSTPKAPSFYWDKFNQADWVKEKQFVLTEERGEIPDGTPPAFMVNAIATASRIDA